MARATAKTERKRIKPKLKRGDLVMVIAGKEFLGRAAPRRGRIIKVLPAEGKVTVEGINVVKKAVRETSKVRQAGIIEMPAPIDISNVMLVCPACDAPTRVAMRVRPDGRKVRVCRRCKQDIDE